MPAREYRMLVARVTYLTGALATLRHQNGESHPHTVLCRLALEAARAKLARG